MDKSNAFSLSMGQYALGMVGTAGSWFLVRNLKALYSSFCVILRRHRLLQDDLRVQDFPNETCETS